ncbi:MAG: hypothetical protein KDC43_21555 [Saprospiraceae bacterium]|nr:hypothetical protein [Saprospiraceae bacterium]MCB0626432.1 hypothetical protein [Saprospiraceae bacterium]MCB0677440.1 hypothetical protein [Saprospiraceae bacterium]MCB0680766.1 hypothetical protein [Saprospiraceae bacterium]
MRPLYFFLFFCLLLFAACKEKTYYYEVNDIEVLPNNADKDKQKSQEQFINIAYANLFQQPLSSNELVDLSQLVTSIGDKQVAFEAIIAKMIGDPDVALPSEQEMRSDVEAFVIETYKRFFVRLPTEAEKTFFVNFIESHPNLTPEHVYFTFATCNEYYYY